MTITETIPGILPQTAMVTKRAASTWSHCPFLLITARSNTTSQDYQGLFSYHEEIGLISCNAGIFNQTSII